MLFMLGNGLMAKNREKEELYMEMAVSMQGSLSIKIHMELVIFNILTKISILDNLLREKNMEGETISSAKVPFSVECGKMMPKYKAN